MSLQEHTPDNTFVTAVASLVHPENTLHEIYRRAVLVIGNDHYVFDDPCRPEPTALTVSTLTAVVDYVKAEIADERVIIQVATPTLVKVLSPLVGDQRQVFVYLNTHPLLPEITFKSFMDPETFLIQLQSAFVATEEREELQTFCSRVRTGLAKEIDDDGVGQNVTVMASLTRPESLKVKNPWMLQPFRTFPEIEQPCTPILLRMRSSKAADSSISASMALFEADGGSWRSFAITRIGAWLRAELPEAIILA